MCLIKRSHSLFDILFDNWLSCLHGFFKIAAVCVQTWECVACGFDYGFLSNCIFNEIKTSCILHDKISQIIIIIKTTRETKKHTHKNTHNQNSPPTKWKATVHDKISFICKASHNVYLALKQIKNNWYLVLEKGGRTETSAVHNGMFLPSKGIARVLCS